MNKRTAELIKNLSQANADLGMALVDLMVVAKHLCDLTETRVAREEKRAEQYPGGEEPRRAAEWRVALTAVRRAMKLDEAE